MAYKVLSEIFSARNTSPYAPYPSLCLILKSSMVRLVDFFFEDYVKGEGNYFSEGYFDFTGELRALSYIYIIYPFISLFIQIKYF
jgi:hypothetical protein